MIKVLLVDDQDIVRQGLGMRLALEPDLVVVGAARDAREALALAAQLSPDVAVLDIEMPGMDGINAIGHLREVAPQCAVVVLTIHSDRHTRGRAEEAGAQAFVEKRGGAEALLHEIRRVGTRSVEP